MKSLFTPIGLAALFALQMPSEAQPAQIAEEQGAPDASATLTEAASTALADVYILVLEDGEGGMASLTNEQGQTALVVFLDPEAATEAQQTESLADMSVAAVPVTSVLENWQGPIVFQGSDAAVANADAQSPTDRAFVGPAFMVLTDGQETQIDMGAGPITPVLLNFEDASDIAAQVSAQGIEASTIDVVPIEFGTVINELSSMETDDGYRVFTHPGTVKFIRDIESQQGDEGQ